MADLADLGAAREELDRELALKTRAPEGPRPTGHCHNCGEMIEGDAFCDVDCRDDWQARQRRGAA